MKLDGIKGILNADVLCADDLNRDIVMACGSDLMSDVLSFIKPRSLLLTGLANRQVVRTAEIAEVAAICFVRGKHPEEDTIKLAREKGISLLSTKLPMFESCGRLYRHGLRGCMERRDEGQGRVHEGTGTGL